MIPGRFIFQSCYVITLSLLLFIPLSSQDFYWPTPDRSFSRGDPYTSYIQPTASNKPYSGLFGCVRNNGRKFHEGIDIKAMEHDAKGEAVDSIYATMDGRVVHVSKIEGNSSYGRYVVLEHENAQPRVYSLYSHLKTIESYVKKGQWLDGGSVIGIMGRSAGGYTIPKSRAHLHFEIGLKLTDDFSQFYKRRKYKVANQHGNWNGMNLVGLNPLEYFMMRRKGNVRNLAEYFEVLPTAVIVKVVSDKVPDFVNRYPELIELQKNNEAAIGWEIEFTWYGMPKKMRVLTGKGSVPSGAFRVELVHFSKDKLSKALARKTLQKKGSSIEMGRTLKTYLELLFGVPIK